MTFNPELDLQFERIVDVPREKIWAAWTTPKLLMPWFCPLPWKTIECEIDLRPGGIFRTVMQSPEGQRFPNSGCYLAGYSKRKTGLDECHGTRLSPRQTSRRQPRSSL